MAGQGSMAGHMPVMHDMATAQQLKRDGMAWHGMPCHRHGMSCVCLVKLQLTRTTCPAQVPSHPPRLHHHNDQAGVDLLRSPVSSKWQCCFG